jgi:hypothetical protein
MILTCLFVVATFQSGAVDVGSFGAKGDSVSDDTAAFQAALDSAGRRHVSVFAGSGNYRFLGKLNVPEGVALKGSWESVPSHNGIRDKGLPKPTDGGTTFLVEGGAGSEDGAFLTLNTNSTLKGVVIYYPKQDTQAVPQPYPWAIAMRGKNPAVLDVELLNPYNGIDASANERHLIRNVSGQPLRRGIFVDGVYDIGRIENVHFNPWWSSSNTLLEWQRTHGEAFIFSRTDWEYVLNTFAFGYGVGYRFNESKDGACNGNFLGIGADDCNVAVKVEQAAPFGLLITNGEFTSFHGSNPTQVVVSAANSGVVRFSNCAFWGPCDRIADVAGTGTVGFGDCTFVQWDGRNKGLEAIRATGGSLLIRGCEFREDKPQVTIEKGVRRAIITDNLTPDALRLKAADPSVVKSN